MSVDEICNRIVTVVNRDETVLEAAKLMREHHVGDVIVVEASAGANRPVGILTDRDIVLEFAARELKLDEFTVGDAVSGELLTLPETMSLVDAVTAMSSQGVRRAPVVDAAGMLVGILTVDDIVAILAEELNKLNTLISTERRHEQRRRS
jgi:CBS domain-containing protein